MKIAIFSDTHLGFGEKGPREKESYSNLCQAIGLCISENADFALLAGDLFDEPSPNHNMLFKAIECFSKAKSDGCERTVVIEKNGEKKELKMKGLPILAIHGNHENKGKETKSALDVLSLSGFLIYFHASKATLQKEGENVFVYGLGAVPEKRALGALKQWNPSPEKGATNILVLHQSFKEFLAVEDEMVATLSLDDLPKGFDLVVNGHLHWANEQKLGDTTFLLAGSTISTAMKKLESEKPKGVHFFDSKTKVISFKELPVQRKIFYYKIKFEEADTEKVISECKNAIEESLANDLALPPLIRLNLKGTLKKGLSPGDVNTSALIENYSQKAIFSVSKNFSSASFKTKISELRELQKSKLSLASRGFELLEKNLLETDVGKDFPAKKLFQLLEEKDIDSAIKLLED